MKLFNFKRKKLRFLEEKEDIKISIFKYKRLIKFIKTLPKNDIVNIDFIEDTHGETWDGYYCELCLNYECEECPMFISGNYCNDSNSIWKKINRSRTYKELLVNLKKMEKLLKSLLKMKE